MLAALALIAGTAHANDAVKVAKPADVKACELRGQVTVYPPYLLPGSDIRAMKRQTEGLGGDTLVVTRRSIVGQGVAYLCGGK